MTANESRGSKTGKPTPESTPSTSGGAHCRVDVRIETQGPVNIYNCTSVPPFPEPCPPVECPEGPIAPGQCVPLSIGSKPKQSQRTKLDAILANTQVPSSIGAAFFHHARRFTTGQTPANDFESKAFQLFGSLSTELRGLLSCAVTSFDAIPKADRNRLFDPTLPTDVNTPLDGETLAAAFVQEATKRVGADVFQNELALEEERPGKNRFFKPEGEFFDVQLRVCKLNGLRTNEFAPALTPGQFLPEELETVCTTTVVNGVPQTTCQVQTGTCPGNFINDEARTCLRVPDVSAGEAVVLEGVNFISVDAKVRLTSQPDGAIVREVDSHVFGDLETPLKEKVDGNEVLVRDCRVHDRLSFVVPDELPPLVFSVQIVMPNVSGIPELGDPIVSNSQFIRVCAPPTARFRISSETVTAREETSPASFGSDEVRVRVRSYPIIANLNELSVGAEQAFDSPEFEDVDSGDVRQMQATLFNQLGVMDGMVMTIMGHEIDSEKAYREQINSFTDAFMDYLKIAVGAIAGSITASGVSLKTLLKFALKHPVLLAIAAAVVLVVILILAAWAPADPIIADNIAYTACELDGLTNADLPMPPAIEYKTQDGIKVKVTPLEKIPTQYKEKREYISDAEDSRYEIVLRYNRVA
jgi:hypothetical protein